jgi:hypothetical protein
VGESVEATGLVYEDIVCADDSNLVAKRTSKMIATINVQSISDEILFMRLLQSVPRKFKMHKIDVMQWRKLLHLLSDFIIFGCRNHSLKFLRGSLEFE